MYVVFARGFAVASHNVANIVAADYGTLDQGWQARSRSQYISDERVIVSMLPFFDGTSEIRSRAKGHSNRI